LLHLVAGLGNPGARYQGTRHNVGFDWVDRVTEGQGGRWRAQRRYQAEMAEWRADGGSVTVMKPQGYMNRSGASVAPYVADKGLDPESVLVAHDDLDLPPGTVRLKCGGGHGGHNGLRDIVEQLGSKAFVRLRIGIGHPGSREEVTPFVLGRPTPEERAAVAAGFDLVDKALPDLLAGNLQRAMNVLHAPAE
jgi:PTH1 family peptidyl-tRNA hydrolase